jgi:hypothetical protein
MRVRVVLKLWVQKFNDEEERQLLTQISHFIETETNDQYAAYVSVLLDLTTRLKLIYLLLLL